MIPAFGPEEWQAIALSLKVAFWATALSLPLAFWVARVLEGGRSLGHQLLNIAVHLPLVLPPVVTGYALLWVFAPNAPLGAALHQAGMGLAFRWQGAALAAAIMGFPLMVRAIRLGYSAIDPGLWEAARTLGLSPWRVFWRVTLPLMLPALLAAAVLGFAKALGEFGATITFVASIPGETRTIPSAIYGFMQRVGAEDAAARLVLVSVAISVSALALSEILAHRLKRRSHD